MRNSGMHGILRTRSSACYRNSGLCPLCAEIHDRRESSLVLWRTSLGFAVAAVSCGLASYVLMALR
jgi:hypothetical protein